MIISQSMGRHLKKLYRVIKYPIFSQKKSNFSQKKSNFCQKKIWEKIRFFPENRIFPKKKIFSGKKSNLGNCESNFFFTLKYGPKIRVQHVISIEPNQNFAKISFHKPQRAQRKALIHYLNFLFYNETKKNLTEIIKMIKV
jgi:hypothetical protein